MSLYNRQISKLRWFIGRSKKWFKNQTNRRRRRTSNLEKPSRQTKFHAESDEQRMS